MQTRSNWAEQRQRPFGRSADSDKFHPTTPGIFYSVPPGRTTYWDQLTPERRISYTCVVDGRLRSAPALSTHAKITYVLGSAGFIVCGMDAMTQAAESAARKYAVLRPHLDERQRRLLLGAEASELGRGGIKAVAGATGVHPDTIARGVREAQGQPEPRVRAPGGGRKKLAETDPALAAELRKLVDPETRGDPMSPLGWATQSARHLAGALTAAGDGVSDRPVAPGLAGTGFP